jgi:hypothetical protein
MLIELRRRLYCDGSHEADAGKQNMLIIFHFRTPVGRARPAGISLKKHAITLFAIPQAFRSLTQGAADRFTLGQTRSSSSEAGVGHLKRTAIVRCGRRTSRIQ